MNNVNAPKITALHVLCYKQQEIGGIYESVPQLAQSLAQNGMEVGLISTGEPWAGERTIGLPTFHFSWRHSLRFLETLPPPWDQPALINFHSCYVPADAMLAWEARRRGIPYIITPRGGLRNGAQAIKKWKKRLGNFAFQDRTVAGAVALHCLTEGEAREAERWQRPIFVVPNGTKLLVERGRAEARNYDQAKDLRVLFLGRLHVQIKGLDLLLQGMSLALQHDPDLPIHLDLVGPSQNGSHQQIQELVESLDLSQKVTIAGPMVGSGKEAAFERAHLFVLTSRHEGHPLGLLEAMAHALPCMVTPGTNMGAIVEEAGAGWSVMPEPHAIAERLLYIVAHRSVLPVMGQSARRLVEERFNWAAIAEQMEENYRKIVTGRDFVR